MAHITRTLVLYIDLSQESETVRKELQRAHVSFEIVYASGSFAPLPALETPIGVIRGYNNIRRYLLPNMGSETSVPSRLDLWVGCVEHTNGHGAFHAPYP